MANVKITTTNYLARMRVPILMKLFKIIIRGDNYGYLNTFKSY